MREYPDEEELARVTAFSEFFPHDKERSDPSAWFALIKSLWWCADWGWREFDGLDDGDPIRVYLVSTGGWSGNESLIDAMRQNFLGWSLTFYSMRRGGHYEFRQFRTPR